MILPHWEPGAITVCSSTKRRNSASESMPVEFHCVSKPVQNQECMMSTQLKYHHRNKLAPKNSNTNHRFRLTLCLAI